RWPRDWSSDVCSSDLFHRREAEESCVKTARLLQDRRGFYVARVAEIGWRHARFQDLLIGKPSNRLDACGQVTPELVDVARAWEEIGRASCRERVERAG